MELWFTYANTISKLIEILILIKYYLCKLGKVIIYNNVFVLNRV